MEMMLKSSNTTYAAAYNKSMKDEEWL